MQDVSSLTMREAKRTASGAPVELQRANINGVSCHIYKHALRRLKEILRKTVALGHVTLAIFDSQWLSNRDVFEKPVQLAALCCARICIQLGREGHDGP